MLQDEIKGIRSDPRSLKDFGITLGVFFILLSVFFWWRGRTAYPYVLTLGVFFLFFALAAPAFLKPVQKVWMTAALLMGWVMTRVILCVIYYLVITPIGWTAKVFGKKFLDDGRAGQGTFWTGHEKKEDGLKSYENQF